MPEAAVASDLAKLREDNRRVWALDVHDGRRLMAISESDSLYIPALEARLAEAEALLADIDHWMPLSKREAVRIFMSKAATNG